MRITIITCCHNREATIGQAMRSVLEQDYKDIEYIIVDGESTDRSMEAIAHELGTRPEELKARANGKWFDTKAHGKAVKVMSERDKGMYEAINKGIKAATGDFIALLHSDDIIISKCTVSHVAGKLKEQQPDMLYADGLFVAADNMEKVIRRWVSQRYSKRRVRFGWLPLHPTCYISRKTYETLGTYDESYKIAADSDLLVRYLLEANLRVVYLNEYVVRMRMGGLSTSSRRRKQMWDEDVRMYRSHGLPPRFTKLCKMAWKVPQFIRR